MADLSKNTLLFGSEKIRMCKTFVNCRGCELFEHNCEFGEYINSDEDNEHILQCVQRWHDNQERGNASGE